MVCCGVFVEFSKIHMCSRKIYVHNNLQLVVNTLTHSGSIEWLKFFFHTINEMKVLKDRFLWFHFLLDQQTVPILGFFFERWTILIALIPIQILIAWKWEWHNSYFSVYSILIDFIYIYHILFSVISFYEPAEKNYYSICFKSYIPIGFFLSLYLYL